MGNKNFTDNQWRDALSKGTCPYGCIVKTKICRHLAQMLPSDDTGAVHWEASAQKPQRIIYTNDIERFAEQSFDPQVEVDNAEAFIETLINKGLNKEEVSIVSDKILLNMSFKDIAEERGYANTMTAFRVYSGALKRIKKEMK